MAPSAYQISKTLIAPAGGLAGVNDPIQFSIVITNTGATTLATVPLTDSYDLSYLSFTGAAPASDDNTDDGLIDWTNIGPIVPGQTKTIAVTFTARAATTSQPGRVTINRTGISGAQDSNGTTLISRTSSAPVAIGAPDLQVTLTDGRTSAGPGDTLTYTILVTNTGTYTATGVVITETMPLNTSFAGGAGWAAQGGGIYTYTLPAPLGIGQGTPLTFVVTVDGPSIPAGVNTIDDTVSVGDDGTHGADATPANNSAADIDTLAAAPDLVITKSDGGVSTIPDGW